jgi:hypothetical protein
LNRVPAPSILAGQNPKQDQDQVAPDNSNLTRKENQPVIASNPKPRRNVTRSSSKGLQARLRKPANTEVANHVTKEVATEFIPLGYMNAANFQDGGQIVRVVLPRSTLASFGLPVNMDRYNEKVKADVLLGVDGLAHAIRFVQ